jgi:AcrR family transcriptional regulator
MADEATLELLWGLRKPSNKGPAAAFTAADIAAAAVGIADERGVGAVSMEEVAKVLGYTKMSLYRYVGSKAELLALMIDLAVGEAPDLSRVRSGWRGKVRKWSELLWQTWDEHPWVPTVTLGHRPVGPRELGWSVALLGVLADLGLSRRETAALVTAISGYLQAAFDERSSGSQPWTPELHLPAELDEVLRSSDTSYPPLDWLTNGRTSNTAASAPGGPSRMAGLDFILDGVEARLARAGR